MPELPDVEVFKRYLDATALHRRVRPVEADADILRDISPAALARRLRGRRLTATRRHGKHLFARLDDDGWLRLHFGMTGYPKYYRKEESMPDHVRLRLSFANGYHLVLADQRKLGAVGFVTDVGRFLAEEGLGPDPLADGLGVAAFRERLRGRRGSVKATLMNQQVIAGLGNVYADEALFQAGVHPAAKTERLDGDRLDAIYDAVARVIEEAIAGRVRNFPPDFLVPHREAGAPCPRCGREIEKIRVSGRSTYFCPAEQPRP